MTLTRKKTFAFFLVVLFVLLVMVEIGARVLEKPDSFDTIRMFQHSDSISFKLADQGDFRHRTGEYDVIYHIEDGLRNPKTDFSAPNGSFRIVLLGDSFFFGHGVSDQAALARRLEAELNQGRERPRVQVVNASYASGKSPDDNYVFLKNRISSLKPDLILHGFFIYNDVADVAADVWEAVDEHGLPLRVRSEADNRGHPPFYLTTPLLSSLASYRYFGKALYRFGLARPAGLTPQGLERYEHIVKMIYDPASTGDRNFQAELERTIRCCRAMKDLARRSSAEYMVVLIPALLQIDSDSVEARNYLRYYGLDLAGLDLKMPQRLIGAMLDQNATGYVDLLAENVLASADYYHVDGHWNPEGHRKVADRLGRVVETLFLSGR
ncbi:MAG: hypothetical protein KKB20_04230 [Proteobacteria bacterium]|nr:hypothetical protein [Pseudomonadota bacterium]